MKTKLSGALAALTSFIRRVLADDAALFLNEWNDPLAIKKNQAIILPDRVTPEADAALLIRILCVISIADTPKNIAEKQIGMLEKLYDAVLSGEDIGGPVLSAKIVNAEFFEPVPGTPNVGVMQVTIDLKTDYLTD
jgi:hypothetical protein